MEPVASEPPSPPLLPPELLPVAPLLDVEPPLLDPLDPPLLLPPDPPLELVLPAPLLLEVPPEDASLPPSDP